MDLRCFVIMPFEVKESPVGPIDFDAVYHQYIAKALDGLRLDYVRCDEIAGPGFIHRQMIEQIRDCDIAVVDITTGNPNVLWELGVRHALRDSTTVLIQNRCLPKIPFNLQGMRVLSYDISNQTATAESIAGLKKEIRAALKKRNKKDSLVYEVLDITVSGRDEPTKPGRPLSFRVKGAPQKRVELLTGNILDAVNTDVWVNSENTYMQMARYLDKCVSAVIRYQGAERDKANRIIKDTIADELAAQVPSHVQVDAGTVIVTGAGALTKRFGVKRIFHVASVQGTPGSGYCPVKDVHKCVTNVLVEMDRAQGLALRSVAFPLLGCGTASARLDVTAGQLLDAALDYLEQKADTRLETVQFVCHTQRALSACRDWLATSDRVVALKAQAASPSR